MLVFNSLQAATPFLFNNILTIIVKNTGTCLLVSNPRILANFYNAKFQKFLMGNIWRDGIDHCISFPHQKLIKKCTRKFL